MTKGLHLSPRHREEIEALLHKHLPGVDVWAYGSRVNGRSHDGSDLDLVLRGPQLAEIDASRLAEITEVLREATVPFLIEARDWARLPKSFHREIEREHVVLVEREERNVSDEWPVKTVQQLVEEGIMERPMDGNHGEVHPKSSDFLRDGIPFIMASNVSGGRVDTKNCAFISEDQARSLRKGFSITEDVLISHKATMGRTALVGRLDVPFIMLTPQVTYYRVIDKGQLDPKYLKNYFDSPAFQQLFETWGQKGSTRSYLGITSQLDLPIVVPPPDVQKSIAHILGTLDDKIELNRRMNETLEAMARALFKSWFVDFDPVRAKMAGRDPGLPKHLADLFPDRLVESELGEIPEGWRQGTLADLARLNPESWSSRNAPDCILYVDLANTKWGYINDIQEYTWEGAPSRGRRVLRLGDTIVGTVRPRNGSFALIDRDGLTGSTAFAVLRPRNAAEREIVWCAATSGDAIERLAHLADGGAYPAVRPRGVLDTAVVLPDARVRLAFSSLAAPFLNRMGATQRESRTLATLRDTLLPKLISGQVRVGGVLAMMEGGDLGRAT